MIGWSSWSQRTARVAPRDNAEVPPHPGGIRSHPRIRNLYVSLQLPTTRGRKRRSPGSIPPRRMSKSQLHWVIADWLGLMEPARGESCPSGQRRGPAAPREGRVLSPDQKSLHISTANSHNPRTKWGSPGSLLPRTVWKPQPHWLSADWLGLMKPTGGEGCPCGQGRVCAAHREVMVPSLNQNLFHISTISINRESRR